MANTVNQANYLFNEGHRRSTISKSGSPKKNIMGTPDIMLQKSHHLLSKNIGNIESMSSLAIYSPNLRASRIMDDRLKSRVVMMPTIKGIFQRKQEGQSHDEFIKRF